MDEGTPRLLVEGRPGIGKTTVARRLLTLLQEAGVPVAGLTTGELRTGGTEKASWSRPSPESGRFWPTSIFRVHPGWAGTVWTWQPSSGSRCRRWATPGPAGRWLSTNHA